MSFCRRALCPEFRLRTRVRFGWSLALVLTAAAPLHAAPAQAQDDAMIEMARERFQEGVRHYDAKQYEKARVAFLQAYALKRHPAVLLNLAQSELRSGHDADAAKHFDTYLRENKEASALERQEAERGLSAAKARVGQIDLRVEDGADIFVDGQPEGRSPLAGPIFASPGSHSVEARKAGQVATTQVDATAGKSATATITFGAASGPTPASGGPAGAEDGALADSSAPEEDAGSASVSLDSESREPFFRWAARNKVAWIGGGLTLVGIGGAIGFSLNAKSHYDAANDIRDQILTQAATDGLANPCGAPPTAEYQNACSKFAEREESGDTSKTLTFVSIGVAAVAAGGTLLYYFIDSGKKRETVRQAEPRRVAFAPLVSPSAAGLTLLGSF